MPIVIQFFHTSKSLNQRQLYNSIIQFQVIPLLSSLLIIIIKD